MRRTSTQIAILSERADGAIDNARIARTYRLISDTESVDRPRAKRFYEYIGCFTECEKGVALAAILQVKYHAHLAAIEVAEKDRAWSVGKPDVPAGVTFAGRLDLDHLGAVIGHCQGQIRTRQEYRQVDDADALE